MAWAATGRESARTAPSFRVEDANPESRDSPMCNRTSGVCALRRIRNDRESRDAGEKGLFRRAYRVGGSHMHPHAIQSQAEQPLLLVGAIKHFRQRKIARG